MISQRDFIDIHIDSDQPLYKRIEDALAGISGAAPLRSPTREQIDEIFAPHQTIEEREISRKFNSGWSVVWLRTCYKPSMVQRYFELARLAAAEYADGCVESLNHVLDDHSLYDFQGSEQGVLDQLLLRLPGLTDGLGIMDEYGDGSELVYGSAIYQSEREGDVRDVGNHVQNYVYVADEEAIEKSRVKIWWFDEFGKIIWDSYAGIPDSDLDGLRGAIMDGQGFLEIVGEDGKRGDRIDR
jgi:hypothetical protein